MTYLRKFCYLNSSCIRKNITCNHMLPVWSHDYSYDISSSIITIHNKIHVYLKALSTLSWYFWKRRIVPPFSKIFASTRSIFKSEFSAVHTKKLIRWKYDSIPHTALVMLAIQIHYVWTRNFRESVTEGFSTFERFAHSTGNRCFNYQLTGEN